MQIQKGKLGAKRCKSSVLSSHVNETHDQSTIVNLNYVRSDMPQLQSKEQKLMSYETASVMSGLFLNYTFVYMRGPHKTIETETEK